MSLRNIEFYLREAFIDFWRSGLMSIVAVATVTVSLIVFGTFLMLVINLNNLVASLSSKLEIMAYLKDDLSNLEVDVLRGQALRLPAVSEVSYLGRDQAWQSFKEIFGTRLNLDEIAMTNPLPDSLVIRVKDVSAIDNIAKQVATLSGIDEVRYGGRLAARVEVFNRAIHNGGWLLIILLVGATLLIIVNTIHLTVMSRQREITIMQLVGATDSFIRWPFIVEGLIIGFLGAALALGVLETLNQTLILKLRAVLPFLPIGFSKIQLLGILSTVALSGMGLGILGGYISVSQSLKRGKPI